MRDEQVLAIVPTKRASDGTRVLALPKGHFDPGETALEPVRELGEAHYWYRRGGQTIGKSVTFFLFSYLAGDTANHDEEVEEVRWLGLREAQRELTHAAEREMVGRALACLEEGRKDR